MLIFSNFCGVDCSNTFMGNIKKKIFSETNDVILIRKISLMKTAILYVSDEIYIVCDMNLFFPVFEKSILAI